MKNKLFFLVLSFSIGQIDAMFFSLFVLKKIGTFFEKKQRGKSMDALNQLFTDKGKAEVLCKSLSGLSFKGADDVEILKSLLLLNKTTNQCVNKFIVATKFYDQFRPDVYLAWQDLDNIPEKLIRFYPEHKKNNMLFNLCNGMLPSDPCNGLKQPLKKLTLFNTRIGYPEISKDISPYIKTCDIKKGDKDNPFFKHLIIDFCDTIFKKKEEDEQKLLAESIKNICMNYTSISFRFSFPDPLTERDENNWEERFNKNYSNNAHALRLLHFILEYIKSNKIRSHITLHFVQPKYEEKLAARGRTLENFLNVCINNSLLDNCRFWFDQPFKGICFGNLFYLFSGRYTDYINKNLKTYTTISASKFLRQFPQLFSLVKILKRGEKHNNNTISEFLEYIIINGGVQSILFSSAIVKEIKDLDVNLMSLFVKSKKDIWSIMFLRKYLEVDENFKKTRKNLKALQSKLEYIKKFNL